MRQSNLKLVAAGLHHDSEVVGRRERQGSGHARCRRDDHGVGRHVALTVRHAATTMRHTVNAW
jgi:hypothetical protein